MFKSFHILADELLKGAQHKYVRRIMTGKAKPKYHYIYSATSVKNAKKPSVGEKIKIDHGETKGHYEVHGVEGDNVHVVHDETGHKMTITKDKLQAKFHDHHDTSVAKQIAAGEKVVAAAKKFGTAKQISRAEASLAKLKEAYGVKDKPKSKPKKAKGEPSGVTPWPQDKLSPWPPADKVKITDSQKRVLRNKYVNEDSNDIKGSAYFGGRDIGVARQLVKKGILREVKEGDDFRFPITDLGTEVVLRHSDTDADLVDVYREHDTYKDPNTGVVVRLFLAGDTAEGPRYLVYKGKKIIHHERLEELPSLGAEGAAQEFFNARADQIALPKPKAKKAGKEAGGKDAEWKTKAEHLADQKMGVSDFSDKQMEKEQRLWTASKNAERKSAAAFNSSRGEVSGIPLGQPILVGHHSEKKHRAALKRSDNAMRRGMEEQKKAEYLANKSDKVGTGGISADDPEAVKKLLGELATAENEREAIKARAKVNRSKLPLAEKIAKLKEMGESAFILGQLAAGQHTYGAFSTSNVGSNIKRIKGRIDTLREEHEARQAGPAKDVEGKGYTLKENHDENRIQFHMEGKPDEDTRKLLKQRGFKWSPRQGAWQRQLNANGRFAAQYVHNILTPTP